MFLHRIFKHESSHIFKIEFDRGLLQKTRWSLYGFASKMWDDSYFFKKKLKKNVRSNNSTAQFIISKN